MSCGPAPIRPLPFRARDVMRIRFRPAKHGPERLLSEAEIHFEEGPLMGTRLLGFGVWRDPEGVLYVTFPSRAIVSGGQRRYTDYLRNVEGQDEAVRRIKAWIVEEYRKQAGLGASREP